MLTLILTRHGLTPRSDPEQHLGQTIDAPLSEEGRLQAAALAIRLAPVQFHRSITSPLLRARQTADIIREASRADRPPPIEVDERAAEMDYGRWEGLTDDQIQTQDGGRRSRWERNPAELSCPDGVSGNDVAARARSFLADLLERAAAGRADDVKPAQVVLVVGHSTFNRVLIAVALDIPIADYRERIVQSQVNLTALRWADQSLPHRATLLLMNDVAHARRQSEEPWS